MPALLTAIIKSSGWKILWTLLVEIVLAIFRRLDWKILLERFVSRLVATGLRKLAKLDSNGMTGKTAQDVLAMLKRSDLPELK